MQQNSSSTMSCESSSSQSRIIGRSNTAEEDDCYLLQMPNEILETIFTGIWIQDLPSLRDTSERLRSLVDHSRKLWATCTLNNDLCDHLLSPHIKKAAACGNFSAIVRTALSFNELSSDTNCPTHAEVLDQLHQVDIQCPSGVPFSWFFYRPRWHGKKSPTVELFRLRIKHAVANPDCHGFDCYNIASILYCFPVMNAHAKALKWLEKAAAKGVSQAAYKLWSMKYEGKKESRKDIQESVSLLHKIQLADPRNKKVQLQLCKYYSRGHYGTLDREIAIAYVRNLFSSSHSYDPADLAKHNSYMTQRDRKLIVNETASIITHFKLGYVFLHQSMKLINQCMSAHSISKILPLKLVDATLTLLLIINWKHIQPLRLTTYRLVRNCSSQFGKCDSAHNNKVFANIFEVTKGNFEMFTIIDYLDVILAMQDECEDVQMLSYYISNLSLMSDRMSSYPEAEIAVASNALARGMHLKSRYDGQLSGFVGTKSDMFPEKIAEFTGISFNTVISCLMVLISECELVLKPSTSYLESIHESMVTHRIETSHSPVEFPGLHEFLSFFNINLNEYT